LPCRDFSATARRAQAKASATRTSSTLSFWGVFAICEKQDYPPKSGGVLSGVNGPASLKQIKEIEKMGKSMKNKNVLWGIVPLLVLTTVLGTCAKPATEAATNSPPTTTANTEANPEVNPGMPRLDNTSKSIQVELIFDELAAQKHITRDITIELTGSLIVTLSANPSTGFQWQEAVIGDGAVLAQYSRQFVDLPMMIPGAGGKDVWTFKTLKTGTTSVDFSYSRPWQGGELNEWTVTLNITVKYYRL
jgi:inhibitor of cysteine peptidase